MNVFVAILWKKMHHRLDPESLLPYLVSEPDQTITWQSEDRGATVLCFTSWGDEVRLPYLIQEGDSAIAFDGFPALTATQDDSTMTGADLWKARANDFRELGGEFSIVSIRGNTIVATSNVGGGHPLYYINTRDCIAFSNRSPLLLQLPGASGELSGDALRWLAYHSYMLRGDTPFSGIKQLIAGDTAHCSPESGLRISALRHGALFRETDTSPRAPALLLEEVQQHCDSMASTLRQLHRFYRELPLLLTISGGKDSRLVLALAMRAGLKDSIEKIFTNGPLYLHDVLSAQDVCAKLGLTRHEIHRPRAVFDNLKLDMGRLVTSVNLTEGRLATHYQVTLSGRRPAITVTGQQAVRDSHYLHCPTGNHQEFMDCVMRSYFHDPAGLLSGPGRAASDQAYRAIFEAYFNDNVPLDAVAEYYMLRERHTGWTSVMNNASSQAGPTANPLLFPGVYDLIFRIPSDLRKLELYHFLMIRACAPQLLDVPFANQQWHPALRKRLAGITDVPLVAPYVNHASFPNMSNPYKPAIKLAYFNALKPFMRHLRLRNAARLRDHFNLEQVDNLLARDSDLPMPALICASGLYTTLLLAEYGADLFHRARTKEIAQEIEDFCGQTPISSFTGHVEQYESALQRHENCIASLCRQSLRGPIKQEESPPGKPSQWYQICISNRKQTDLEVYLLITRTPERTHKTAVNTIAGGETFFWGARDLGGTTVEICCDDIGFRQRIPIDINTLVHYTEIPS